MSFVNATLFVSGNFQNQLNGQNMLSGADNNTEGTPLLVFEVDSPAATTTNVTVTNGIRVIDVLGHKNAAGGGGETLQTLNAGNAITGTLDINVANNAFIRLAADTAQNTIDDAQQEIAPAGTLRETTVGAVTSAADIYVLATRT